MEADANKTPRDQTSGESSGPLLDTFAASYRAAFESANIHAIRRHFADRICVASDTGAEVRLEVLSDADLRAVIDQLVSQYRVLGVAEVETRELEIIQLSARLGLVLVRWALLDDRGDAIYEFSAAYTLVLDGVSCRIVSIAHDEIAQARQFRATRRS